jgi:hypothetical protein
LFSSAFTPGSLQDWFMEYVKGDWSGFDWTTSHYPSRRRVSAVVGLLPAEPARPDLADRGGEARESPDLPRQLDSAGVESDAYAPKRERLHKERYAGQREAVAAFDRLAATLSAGTE